MLLALYIFLTCLVAVIKWKMATILDAILDFGESSRGILGDF